MHIDYTIPPYGQYRIHGWVKNLTHLHNTGVAQTQISGTMGRLSQAGSSLPSSPLKELQKILGSVIYHSNAPEETMAVPPEKSLVQEGKYPIPEDVWYMDGSSKGNPRSNGIPSLH